MHSAVLQNKKYIQFADKNTVEVIRLTRLEQGIEAGDRKAATYKGEDESGNPVEYLIEFPGLTVEDIQNLARSQARTYNNTGRIPYTSLVNPHTLEEMQSWSGSNSAKSIMGGVMTARKKLSKKYGKGFGRAEYREFVKSESDVPRLLDAGDFKRAFHLLSGVSESSQKWPESLTDRFNEMNRAALESAEAELRKIQEWAETDPPKAKKALQELSGPLRGTRLAEKVQQMMQSLS